MSVLPIRDLANAYEMGLGGSLMAVAAVLDSVYASSLPGIPWCPGTHRRVVGPGRALGSAPRWWVTGERRSTALSND